MMVYGVGEYRLPLVSKDPHTRVLGPKHHEHYTIWALKPNYLGPWTLRVRGEGI